MMKNNKGFAVTGLIYILLLLFILLFTSLLVMFANRKQVLEKIKDNIRGEESGNVAKIYGVKRLISSNSSAFERINDSVGLKANAVIGTANYSATVNAFDNIYPWNSIETYKYDASTLEEITPDDDRYDESEGDVLTRIPDFYYKRYQENGYEYILISNKNVDETYTYSPAFSLGRYVLSSDDNVNVYSKSNKTIKNSIFNNLSGYRTAISTKGNDFGLMDYHYFIIQLLYLVEYADYNSQAKLGKGFSGINYVNQKSGLCDELKMKSGTVQATINDPGCVNYRGLENIYGNLAQYLDGFNIKTGSLYINYNHNTYSDLTSSDYKVLINSIPTSGGFAKTMGYNADHSLIQIPSEVGGNSSTYLTDYYWTNITSTATTGYLMIGGAADPNQTYHTGLFASVYVTPPLPLSNARMIRYK